MVTLEKASKKLLKKRHSLARSLAMSALASIAATGMVRALKNHKPAASHVSEDELDDTPERADEHETKKRRGFMGRTGDEQNFVFIFLPLAFSLDGLRYLAELRKSRAHLQAEGVLRERFARGEIDEDTFVRMQRALED